MIGRYRGALTALFLIAGVVSSSQLESTQPFASTDQAFVPASATISPPNSFHASIGFDLVLPPGWVAYDRHDALTRRSYRWLVIVNKPITVPERSFAPLPWGDLDPDVVGAEIVDSGGLGGGSGPTGESTFPLDWAHARPSPTSKLPSLAFQNMLRSFVLNGYYGPTASAADRDSLTQVIASIRPEPLPASGVYQGWDILGPVTSYPTGTVRHFDTSQSPAGGFFLVRGKRTTYALMDHAYQFMGAMKTCVVRYDAPARVFICDDSGERWSRVGKQLGGSGYFSLAYHIVFVKDGVVLVGGGSANGTSRNTEDEAAEFDDPIDAPTPAATLLTKAEIIARYSRVTTTDPTTRSAAKLVPRDAMTTFVRGALVSSAWPAGPYWVVAFSGPVHIAGSGDPLGFWAVFIADAHTGAVMNAACCEGGDWPPGFDALPDLSR